MNNTLIYAVVLIAVVGSVAGVVIMVPSETAPIIGFGTLIGLQVLALLSRIANEAKTEAKVDKLSTMADDNKKQNNEIQKMVNGRMEEQLKLTHAALQRIADLTKDPADIGKAAAAQVMYEEHSAKNPFTSVS